MPTMIIRHGEKPADGLRGIRADGRQDTKSLTTVGWARAGALLGLFDGHHPLLPRPVALFASHHASGKPGSYRQEQTVSLLADRLALSTDMRFGVGDEAALAGVLAATAEPTLVCWEHKNISVLAEALGVADAPKWPKARFDVVWVIADGTLTQVPELLLPGDSPEPIS